MKSKLEILKETRAYYETHYRAVNHDMCSYLTSDGKMCAYGRCTINPAEVEKSHYNKKVTHFESKINEYLKEEYRGHDVTFWSSIQSFHDNHSLWNGRELTVIGIGIYNQMKEKFEKELVQEVVSV